MDLLRMNDLTSGLDKRLSIVSLYARYLTLDLTQLLIALAIEVSSSLVMSWQTSPFRSKFKSSSGSHNRNTGDVEDIILYDCILPDPTSTMRGPDVHMLMAVSYTRLLTRKLHELTFRMRSLDSSVTPIALAVTASTTSLRLGTSLSNLGVHEAMSRPVAPCLRTHS